MFRDYTRRMRELLRRNAWSRPVRLAMDYVEGHLHEPLGVAALAKKHGKPVYSIVGNMGVILRHPEYLHDVACFICNEKDVYEALVSGKLGGYGADVMENELAENKDEFVSPLFECDKFIVSPHAGAQTVDAAYDIGQFIIAKCKEALKLD